MRKVAVWAFAALYLLTSTLSAIHSVDMFSLATTQAMAMCTAAALEIGAACCLVVSLLRLRSAWTMPLFLLVTSMQVLANVYSAYVGVQDYSAWSELLGMVDQDPVIVKRTLSCIVGGVIPVVALGFVTQITGLLDGPSAPQVNGATYVTRNELPDLIERMTGIGTIDPKS